MMARNQLNFTKRALDSLPLPEKGYIQYYDSVEHGLILRVYASGTKTFYLYRKLEGRPEYILLRDKPPSRYPDMTPDQARMLAIGLRGEIGKGKNPAEDKRNVRDEMTLGQLFERYLAFHAQKHKRSWKCDENMFRLYFSHWAGKKISTISRRDVQDLHAQMGEQNGKSQANRAFAMLRTVFEKGLEWGWDKANPCFKLKIFPHSNRDRFIRAEELPGFFKAVRSEQDIKVQDFLLLLLYTGARKSNVLSMAWADVNMDLRLWNIPAEKSKNGTAYTVPLVDAAFEILSRRQGANPTSPWVLPAKKNSGYLSEPKEEWNRIRETSGIQDVHIHDLRRTLGSWMAITGASEYVIKGALGHKTAGQSVTGIYARLSVEPIRTAMEMAVRTMLCKGKMNSNDDRVIDFRASM